MISERFFLLLTIILGLACKSYSQSHSSELPLENALKKIEQKLKVKFFFRPEWIQDVSVSEQLVNLPITAIFSELDKKGLAHLLIDNSPYIILFRGAAPSVSNPFLPDSISVRKALSEVYSMRGKVYEANSNQPLLGATIVVDGENKGVVTDHEGKYSFSLPEGIYRLRITAVGKLPTIRSVTLDSDSEIDFEMYEHATQLDGVTITSESLTRNISSAEMSQIKMDIKTLKSIPPFMGEVDLVKGILLLPGVSTVGEGASGFNVRGGNVDQNLILLDDAPLLNSSHLFGFFSTFNSDFVKDLTLYKGGMPAAYGGRVSSVLDVRLKDGNDKKISISGGLGIISSRLMIEGPIGSSGKTTFVLGGRYAYPNWIIKKVPDLNVQRSSGDFYDFNLRGKHKFNDKNSLAFSGYHSTDNFKFAADTTYAWSTSSASLRWNTIINSNLFANMTGFFSRYRNRVDGLMAGMEFTTDFGVDIAGGKIDLTYTPDLKHKIDFGYSMNQYMINPGKLASYAPQQIDPVNIEDELSHEQGFYLSDDFKFNETISVQGGLRYSLYASKGPADILIYQDGVPKRLSTVMDTLFVSPGDNVARYSGLEPRVSMKISIGKNSSIKLSYNRNYQYLHLISNTAAVSPLDLWKSSNRYVKPQIGDQIAAGYFRNFKDNNYELSLEAYYKQTENLLEYKDGAELFMNTHLETQLLSAKGKAYGMELMIKKNNGKWTGWISYAYARSFRRVKGNSREETLNSGSYFPSNFDKPNDLTIVQSIAFTKRLSLSANFTYSTGRPITYPQSVYVIDNYSVAQFSDRNQGRIPDYHRLDLSFTINESLRATKKWKGSWTFSVYNLYGRKNPYSVFFKPQMRGSQTQAYRLAVIGTVFPSITYNFKL